jgi:hypothetical protein
MTLQRPNDWFGSWLCENAAPALTFSARSYNREFRPETGSRATGSSATQFGLRADFFRLGRIRRHSRGLGWGAPVSGLRFSVISVRARRVSGASLCCRFSNFRFGGAETGSTADRDWLYTTLGELDFLIAGLLQAIAPPRPMTPA